MKSDCIKYSTAILHAYSERIRHGGLKVPQNLPSGIPHVLCPGDGSDGDHGCDGTCQSGDGGAANLPCGRCHGGVLLCVHGRGEVLLCVGGHGADFLCGRDHELILLYADGHGLTLQHGYGHD